MALASAHAGLHGSAQMENPTEASTATLRTIIAIAATSMVESSDATNASGTRAAALIWIMLPVATARSIAHRRYHLATCRAIRLNAGEQC